jgi:PEP-CTERM motif
MRIGVNELAQREQDMRRFLRMLAGTALGCAATAGTAGAVPLLSLSGGTEGSIPAGFGENDFLGAGNTATGFYGAQLGVTEAGKITVEFLGFEAAFRNDFNFAGAEIFDTGDFATGAVFGNPLAGPVLFDVPSGLLPFSFDVDSDRGGVANGANPDNTGSDINFFASFDLSDASPLAAQGSTVLLFLDDAGGGGDDNHDDMVIRISAVPEPTTVPEPSTLALLGGALAALSVFLRRRRRSA